MNKELLIKQWSPYASLLDTEQVASLLALPLRCAGEDPRAIVPSIALAPDGPKLQAIILFLESLICELRIDPNAQMFDFVRLDSVRNYKVWKGRQVITRADAQTVSYDLMVIQLWHEFAPSNVTVMQYVGMNLDEWLTQVLAAFPVKQIR